MKQDVLKLLLKVQRNLKEFLEEFLKKPIHESKELSFYRLNNTYKEALKFFDCSDVSLNTYASSLSFQDEKRGLSKTYLGFESKGNLVSFFSLSAGEIDKADLPRATKPYPSYPVIRLGRLAVDKRYQFQGYGYETMIEVFRTYLEVVEKIGAIALVVDAYPSSVSFYEKVGFDHLLVQEDKTESLFLFTQTIKQK